MSFCGTPFVNSLPSQEAVFRAELNALPSLHERAQRIDQKLHQARTSLGSRDEKLLGLRSDFDALTLAFWREFGRGLGCTDPAATIAHEQARLRSVGFIGTILCVLVVTIWVVAVLQNGGDTGVAVCVLVFALCGIGSDHPSLAPDGPRAECLRRSRARTITILAYLGEYRVIESLDGQV